MKRILLIGIEGVYNYGCEAILRGTHKILKNIKPDCEITYASYNYKYDHKRLQDLDLKVIEARHLSKWSIRNVTRKILSCIGIKLQKPFDNPKLYTNYDCVLSIGGDMYTLNHNGKYDSSLPLFMRQLKKQGAKYILWGCSVGPFEKNPKALAFFKKHLSEIDSIIARENVTIEYLKSIGINDNVQFAPDPAFVVDGPKKEYCLINSNEGITIGLNLSPLSALYEYGDIDKALMEHKKSVEYLVDKYKARIILLPHVLGNQVSDNDYLYLSKLKDSLNNTIQNKVSIIDSDPGFVGIKNFIINCDVVIASRMHCAINAIACGVPTLFLSYSAKAYGMSEFVYGSKNNVISLKAFTDSKILTQKINNLLGKEVKREEIKSFNYSNIF